jgi:MOSC domain-containing protein YiiM
MSAGRLESINTSRGGVPKMALLEGHVTVHGLAGDFQDNLRYHGGRDRAILVFSLDLIRALQLEGHPIGVGTTGENFTVSGLDWNAIGPGRELSVGEVRLLVTSYAAPCETIRGSFLERDFMRISQKQHPGWSRLCTRVIHEGTVRQGDAVNLRISGSKDLRI